MDTTRNSNQWLIELSKEDIWSDHTESIPSMIYQAYSQLKALAMNGQV